MIERLYIRNYKGFVNFEMKCESFVFLMGQNGSGKSSILEVLSRARVPLSSGPGRSRSAS